MATAPFPVDPRFTAIAIKYRNARMIADLVLPRVPVAKKEFKYLRHTLAEGFTLPDTKVGRRSRPTEVEFSGVEVPDSTQDYALDDPIPAEDLMNAAENYDPMGRATEGLADLIALDREVRAANLVFTLGNYPAAQRTTLSGTSQWNDFVNSDPITAISGGLDAMVMRANVMVIGRLAWTRLSQHPRLVKAITGYANDAGIVTRQQVAALFELDEVVVGEAFLNTAKKGQATTMNRVWGKHCALIHRDGMADGRGNRTTFGFTAEFGTRVAGAITDPDIGMRGGTRMRVGESVKELIAASDLGYFFQNAVA
jgi:hypothetical protein